MNVIYRICIYKANPTAAQQRRLDGDTDFIRNGAEPAEVTQAQLIVNPSNTVVQGTMIQAVLETAIDSSLAGQVRAMVSEDVHAYDGSRILIPRGARLIGRYQSGLDIAQRRVTIAWDRISPDAALPWLEFKDTLKRNYELAETLPAMADSLLSDFDSLREHFVKAGFEIERFERFECEKDVVNYAVLVRRPWRDEVFGLGDAYVGYENSVTRALPRDAARGTVKELLRRQKKNFHEANGTEIAFKADRTAQSIAAILGEDCLRSLPIEEVERTNAGVIYRVPEGARAGRPVPAGASPLFDLREDGDAWIG